MKKSLIFLLILSLFPIISYAEELSLKNALDVAMEKSPAVVSAKQEVIAADARLGQAFGTLLPNLSASGKVGSGYMQPYDMAIQATLGTVEQNIAMQQGVNEIYSTSNYSVTISQPIFMMGVLPALDAARNSYEIAKQNYLKADLDLEYNVVNSYYGYLKVEKLYELAKDSLDQANSHLNQAQAMLSAGTATRADVLRAEVQVANMELGLLKAKNSLAIAKDAFNNTLSRDLDANVDLSEKEIANEYVTPLTFNECEAKVFDNRPDWKIFQLNKMINKNRSDIAYSGYFPNVSLVGNYGANNSTYQTNSFLNANYFDWTVTANAQWMLFDGLATPSRVKEAQANLAAFDANEQSFRNGIILEVKDACLNLETSVDLIKSAKKTVDLARENYRISKERYRTGAGSNLEMIDAETAFTEAQNSLYQSQFDYQIAKAKVNQATGAEIYPFGEKEGK